MLPLFAALLGSPVPMVEPLGAVAARLGAALGRPIEAERALARIPVLVDAPSLGPDATLRALSAAVRATLVQDGKTLRIERTPADRKALSETHRKVVRARVDAGLAAWDEALSRFEGKGDVAAQVRAATAQQDAAIRAQRAASEAGTPFVPPPDTVNPGLLDPVARLLRAILGRLGSARLAASEPEEVRFLSDRPNRVESPLPNVADLLDAYVEAQAPYAEAMDRPAPEGRPAKLALTLYESGASLDLYDAVGKRVDRGGASYGQVGVFYSRPPEPPAATPNLVPLDDAARRLRALCYPPDGPVTHLQATSLPETYLHPERFDPLDFEVRAALLALPRASGAKGTVAALSDVLLGLGDLCTKNGVLDASAFAWRLEHEGGYERIVQNGVERVRPKDALRAEAEFADRRELGRAIRRVAGDGGETLGNLTALHLALYTGHAQPATSRYLRPFWRLGRANLQGLNLAPGGWALLGTALLSGKDGATGNAPPFDRLLADGVVQGWLRFERAVGASDLDAAPSSLLASMPAARLAFASQSATVVKVYGGFDANGPIRLQFEQADLEGIRKGFDDALGPEALGADLALPGRRSFPGMPIRPMGEEDRRQVARRIQGLRYLLGNRIDLGVDVFVGRALRARIEARDWTTDRRGTAFDDLPPAFREAVLRGAQRALAQAGG